MIPRKIRGIGIDILEIDRIKKAHEKHGEKFLEKIFTPGEIAYCFKHKNPYPRLAVRFSAKEAVAKALGCGIGHDLSFLDVEIVHKESGAPEVRLSIEASKKFKKPHIHISLSHTEIQATAMVVID